MQTKPITIMIMRTITTTTTTMMVMTDSRWPMTHYCDNDDDDNKDDDDNDDYDNNNIRRESSGGMEWLGVWNCNFSGSEFSNFGAWNLAKIALVVSILSGNDITLPPLYYPPLTSILPHATLFLTSLFTSLLVRKREPRFTEPEMVDWGGDAADSPLAQRHCLALMRFFCCQRARSTTCEIWPLKWTLSWALPQTPSWDVSWDLSWGDLEGLRKGKVNVCGHPYVRSCGCSRGCFHGRSRVSHSRALCLSESSMIVPCEKSKSKTHPNCR